MPTKWALMSHSFLAVQFKRAWKTIYLTFNISCRIFPGLSKLWVNTWLFLDLSRMGEWSVSSLKVRGWAGVLDGGTFFILTVPQLDTKVCEQLDFTAELQACSASSLCLYIYACYKLFLVLNYSPLKCGNLDTLAKCNTVII